MSDSLQPQEHQASLSFTISQSLCRLVSTESVMPFNHLILCHHLLLLPSIFPSIRVFSTELARHIRWPKELQLQHQSFQRIFRIDWFDLFVVQGALKSLFQHCHSWKASILQHSAFFMVQLSHPYMTTGKTIALTMQTFVSKVMSLPFNTLSSFVLAFLPRSKRLLNRPLFPLLPIYLPWSDGTGCRELSFWVLSFKPAFSLSSSTFLKGSLVPLHFLPWGWCHLHIWDSWSFFQAILIPACDTSTLAPLMM